MTRSEAQDEYARALKMGQKAYKEAVARGKYPYLPVLDDLLETQKVDAQQIMGQVEIPLDQLVGTKTAGRTAAFAANFMPLLGQNTEFASKWITLCAAHVDEGIRDPVRCYEYRNKFYVQEGNKRVSVLKYFGADSITADLIRVVPAYAEDAETKIYYEFMEFYRLSGIYYLTFSQEGSYAKLQAEIGKQQNQAWTDEDRMEVNSLYNWIKKAYYNHGGGDLPTTVGDALLLLLQVYGYKALQAQSPTALAQSLDAVWDELQILTLPQPVAVSTQPAEPAQVSILERILPVKRTPSHLKVAFINVRTPQTSTWTNAHEFGRTQLDQVFEGRVETVAYHGAEPGKNDEEMIEKAVAEGADLIFTTSPQLVGASLRAAVLHPEVRILNCSMEMHYASIRTYYSRVFEAKFITGAIAGAMAAGDRVGYVATYPIFGEPANINAFALGARMVNPRVRVQLEWTCLPGDPLQSFARRGVTVVSGRDTPLPGRPQREFGTFQIRPGGILQDLASPFWHWGQFYEHVVRSVLDGSWDNEQPGSKAKTKALNYWWGMSSGVIDVLFSRELPHDVRHLAEILRAGIIAGRVEPFACHITGQDGRLKNEGLRGFTPDQIMHMDWLCDAVEGEIPEYEALNEEAKSMYRMQGLHRDRLPAAEEGSL
ncbi:MAG: BMP family ABC transporter substrate-binding protein [Gemmiger sp.]|nr:BMP family ABC transporter substrate-binding protein [Gemmiger sp.]